MTIIGPLGEPIGRGPGGVWAAGKKTHRKGGRNNEARALRKK